VSTPFTRWIGGLRVAVPPRREGAPRRALWPMVAPILRSLSKREGGRSASSYKSLRAMVYQDHGYVCGDESLRVMVNREARRGTLQRRQAFANASDTTGRILIRLPDVAELRRTQREAKVAKRKERKRAQRAAALLRVGPAHVMPAGNRLESAQRERSADAHVLQHVLPQMDRAHVAAHVRSALAAIHPVKPASPITGEEPHKEPIGFHLDDVDARRAAVQRQLAALAALDLEPKKPPE
jgi:hypothetical protein